MELSVGFGQHVFGEVSDQLHQRLIWDEKTTRLHRGL